MILIFLFFSLSITSCTLDEYSHMEAPEVSSCTLEEACIQIVFSSKMKKEITEAAFSCLSSSPERSPANVVDS